MDARQLRECRSRLESFLRDLLEPLGRTTRRHWGNVYVRGLLLDGERKSIEPMADRMPDGNVQAMQQLIGQSLWDFRPIRRGLAERMAQELIPACAWIVDDTGFPKKGDKSVGVARQYSGTLGKVANCQVAVSLHLATDEASMPLNYQLYLPQEWTDNPERLGKAGVPEDTGFKTKWQLALDLTDEALGWNLPAGVVVCDIAYGKVNDFRQELIDRQLGYVAEIESKTIVFALPPRNKPRRGRQAKAKRQTISVKDLSKALPSWSWKTIRWREGTKKRLTSRFAALRVDPAHGHSQNKPLPPRQWLLIEWALDHAEPCRFWFSNLPPQAGLRRLVRLAKLRWRVEQNYQQQKEELGLDHYEGRGYLGWHHHVTLNMMAYGFLLLETLRAKKNFWIDPPDDPVVDPENPGDLDRNMSHM
jgi:SRSO17 transposase